MTKTDVIIETSGPYQWSHITIPRLWKKGRVLTTHSTPFIRLYGVGRVVNRHGGSNVNMERGGGGGEI